MCLHFLARLHGLRRLYLSERWWPPRKWRQKPRVRFPAGSPTLDDYHHVPLTVGQPWSYITSGRGYCWSSAPHGKSKGAIPLAYLVVGQGCHGELNHSLIFLRLKRNREAWEIYLNENSSSAYFFRVLVENSSTHHVIRPLRFGAVKNG
jgi:hypothetical protein